MHHDFFYAAETALRSNSGMHCLVDEQGKENTNLRIDAADGYLQGRRNQKESERENH